MEQPAPPENFKGLYIDKYDLEISYKVVSNDFGRYSVSVMIEGRFISLSLTVEHKWQLESKIRQEVLLMYSER